MFEEICLVCSKQLKDDGRAYCSDDCQNSDLSSPSISSSSSALSSPNMGYAVGGDVPALMPSALGSALRMYAGRHISSSSSSASWSALTDDEDDDRYARSHDLPDAFYDASSKSANHIYTINSRALSYARRPSGTNNHSTVPHLHRRLSSGSSSSHVQGYPRSAPITSHTAQADDDVLSDFGSAFDIDDSELHSDRDGAVDVKSTYSATTKPKRSRNRASLPACFSLLQMTSPKKDTRTSPMSSSSGNTIARLSPPTPKLPVSTGMSHVLTMSSIPPQSTPRGRRREADKSRSSRRSGPSQDSRSRSRARRIPLDSPRQFERSFYDGDEQLFDFSDLPRRGRETTRRNSSPPPHEVFGRTGEIDRARSGSDSLQRARGRARVEDLGESGRPTDAPGYGNGRSGLVHRERGLGRLPL